MWNFIKNQPQNKMHAAAMQASRVRGDNFIDAG